MGTLSAAVTIVSGFVAADQLGHDSPGHDFVHVHRDLMIAALVCSVVASALALFVAKRESSGSRWAVALATLVTTALAMLGADRGAVLVYQYGMGVGEPPPHSESAHDHAHAHGDALDSNDATDDSDAHPHGNSRLSPAPPTTPETNNGTTLEQAAPPEVTPPPAAAEPHPSSDHEH